MGVLLDGEVQRGVGRVQVRLAGLAVGDPGHGDLAEDRAQASGVAGFHVRPARPIGASNLDPALPHGTQVHVVLKEQAKQFAAFDVELTFQLSMFQSAAGLTIEPAQDQPEALTGSREALGPRRLGLVAHRPRRARNAAMPASAARSSSARAVWKRANPATTSATSASASVKVLVRPASV